ncbi:MAG: hypothetical protein ACI8WB_000652 [Phenylobacterium sp.]|jgi:hypothetical protein
MGYTVRLDDSQEKQFEALFQQLRSRGVRDIVFESVEEKLSRAIEMQKKSLVYIDNDSGGNERYAAKYLGKTVIVTVLKGAQELILTLP